MTDIRLLRVSVSTLGSVLASRLVGAFGAANELVAATGWKFGLAAAVPADETTPVSEPNNSATLPTAKSLRP
jgi:hypothetical protein